MAKALSSAGMATLMGGIAVLAAGAIAPSAALAQSAVSGANFQDAAAPLTTPHGPTATLSEGQGARFASLNPTPEERQAEDPRRVQIEITAPPNGTGLNLSVLQRALVGSNRSGDVNRQSHGSEVRVGRALGEPSGGRDAPDHRVYMFAASDDQALTWQPGGGQARGFGYQDDRVEIGDRQAGVTYEHGNVQASVAYVERKISASAGRESASHSENFAGVTLTMRH